MYGYLVLVGFLGSNGECICWVSSEVGVKNRGSCRVVQVLGFGGKSFR